MKNNFLICASQLDTSCQTDLIKGVLTILSIAVFYYNQVTTILSIAVHYLGVKFGVDLFTPSVFNEDTLMLRLSGGSSLVVINSGFCGCHQFWCYKDMKPPLYGQQGSLYVWVGVFCIREVDVYLSLLLTQRDTYLLHPPVWSC